MQYHELNSEQELIDGCVQGHRMAQKHLYKKFYGSMLVICMRYTRNREEAVEVLNDAFLKVFQNIATYKGTGALAAWIARIVFHTAIDQIRKNTSYKNKIDLESEADHEVASEALDKISAKELMAFIQQVSPASRSVFSLYAIEGYTHKEIADLLDISVGTSKWHLSNARKELKRMLVNSGNYMIAI
ncbi:MAG: RNA polymerase sigma factor [Cyclobacteriaceae bacterium]